MMTMFKLYISYALLVSCYFLSEKIFLIAKSFLNWGKLSNAYFERYSREAFEKAGVKYPE